jgi:hypothetical protein
MGIHDPFIPNEDRPDMLKRLTGQLDDDTLTLSGCKESSKDNQDSKPKDRKDMEDQTVMEMRFNHPLR